MKTGLLIGYFAKRDEARQAWRKLRARGYLRTAWVGKNSDGAVQIWDPFPRRQALVAVAAFLLFGVLATAVSVDFPWLELIRNGSRSDLIPVLLAGCIGALLSVAWMRRSIFGVERKLLADHARWLAVGETVLILQAPIDTLWTPLRVLLESSEIPPAVFVFHPRREIPGGESENRASLLAPAEMLACAERLATEQGLAPKTPRGAELLERLERGRRWIHQACQDLTEAGRLEQSLSPTAEWLLDNEYIFESSARDVRLNLPRRYYRQLPALAKGPCRGLPRIYGMARELASHTDLRMDQENIEAFIESYQSVASLSIGELWAVPQMLRTALMEGIQQLAARSLSELRDRERADFWANRIITANRRDTNPLFGVLAELTKTHPTPTPYFALQLMGYLYDEGLALAPVQSWLERTLHASVADLSLQERNRQTRDQISIGNAFTSLRQLALHDWKKSFEQLSRVEQVLRQDPAGIYPQMDFDTRDRYRRAVEDLHRGSGVEEEQVARRALEVAGRAGRDASDDERNSHVGTYLIGERRPELARAIGCRETVRFRALHWAYHHHASVYLLALGFLTGGFISLSIVWGLSAQAPGIKVLIALLLLIPGSQLALEVVNYLVVWWFPPRALPKMDFRLTGIPDACRTLVVVPMMLVDMESIQFEADKLEIRYLANKEANLLFGLFTDFKDAAEARGDADAFLLSAAKQCIEALNQRHGSGRFFLFHRERKWSESEQSFIGWERKRGKLEELNRLLDGTRPREAEDLVAVGDPEQLTHVRFVITLDSDTQLPHDTARRMIETLAHPGNQPRLDAAGRVVAGYTIIQPRVSPSPTSTSGSPFSRLFSDAVGIDPYTHAVSDVNQDLAGEGSYHGKGIYDVRAFSRVLSGRFPDGRLLSHDLIEGAHVRVGLASDIELYDEVPQDYLSYVRRQHRWIRGDWQIADWILPRVPVADGRCGPNALSRFNRWKVFDNLRRSLLPAASLSLLAIAWMISSRAGWMASAVVAAQLLFHSLAQPFAWATARAGARNFTLAKAAHDLLRVGVEAALLPCQAWLALDAIVRVAWRRLVSHRNLLQWTSAQATVKHARDRLPMFLLSMSGASLLGILVAWAVLWSRPENLWVAGPWLVLWLASPLLGWLLCRRPLPLQPQSRLSPEEQQFLRNVARRTWRYFADFVNEKTSWLPPDNYQVAYQNQLAMRTSPTNIGLWMASVVGAHDFGYLTVDEVVYKLTRTMETVAGLERHEGHLLNWYDIRTRAPLTPRYVSTVDSGNLLGALWALDHGLAALVRAPLLDARAFAGLRDAGEILQQAEEEAGLGGRETHALGALLRACASPPDHIADILVRLRQVERGVGDLSLREPGSTPAEEAVAYWAGAVRDQLAAWLELANRYLGWIEILGEKSEAEFAALDPDGLPAFRAALERAPSLFDLAQGDSACIASLEAIRRRTPADDAPLRGWIDRVLEAYGKSKWLAGEMLAACERTREACRELSQSINMSFLYNPERRLFSIGYNVSEGRLDRAFYDLLASEARLGSLVAIARGDVPVEHWFAMNRPYGAVGRHRALLSWTGTMFEYLMPLLFQRSYANSLLDKAAREAVSIQIAYGRKHRVPWGMSESAFADLDLHKTYQYSAFGVPELGLKHGLAGKMVIAPYATLLAVSIAPRAALSNLKRLDQMGLLHDYGYFEAMDFSRSPGRDGVRGVVVRAYMAHHEGMGFLALTNFLHGNAVQESFHADPRVRTVEPLLQERIPHLPPLHHIATRERVSSVAAIGEVAPSVSQFETPHTTTPKTQLLCNGRYGLLLTNAGGGYSRWGDFEITRWRSDRTRDAWGTFCYIQDADSGRLWCNSYHPIGGKVEEYCVNFALDRTVFRRADHGIESETEVVVTPEDDVEIRRITLINRSLRKRRLNLTSYLELALAPHNADRQHPAFNKLFIQTEAIPLQEALLAYRRPRSADDPPIFVAHRFTLQQAEGEALRFETDRRRFIGRGRTLADPMGGQGELGNSEGFVLDPILSLRRSVVLSPGQRVEVSLVLAAGETREDVLGLMSKYGDPHAIDRAMDFAWAAAQLELRLLHIQPDAARWFQQLASHVLFPGPLLRSPAERLRENRTGQAGLWAHGISGDLPIALVVIGEARDLPLVRQVLQAHTYWRMHGLVADLIILNEEAGGYTQPLREQLERLIQSHATTTGVERPGGVFLRSAELLAAEDLTLLRAVASVVLVAARGTLPQQLGLPQEAPEVPAALARRRDRRRDASAALPFMELPFFNSLGGFTLDGREYATYLGPGIHTPAPWANVIANPSFGTLVSETGAGFTWQGNSQRHRLTAWSNDPVVDPPSEAIYIRDEETGIYWTPTASPIREETAYRARHGAGYSVFEHNSHGIEQELTVFVPMDEAGGKPIKLQRLVLRNDTSRPRNLSVTYYVEWTLGETREASQMHVATAWDGEVGAILARNRYHADAGDRVAFAALSGPTRSHTGDRTVFLGRNRSMRGPAAMGRARLSQRTGAGLDPCAAVQAAVKLAPGERVELTCMLGSAASLGEVHALVRAYREDSAVATTLGGTRAWWDDRLGTIQVHTPELSVDLLLNRWLLYQSLSCRMWGRSAVYQSGGAFGFRDQLQDTMALVYAHPELAREHILLAASRQFLEGDVQHWWHPPGGAGIRSRISDDLLWLPHVVAHYIRTTGDVDILHEQVPFLDAPSLKDDQHESFQTPEVSTELASLFEHCRRAVARGQRFGSHGLPLMGTGDWNDGMNLVGAEGRGESVWLAWFLVDVLESMAKMADLLDRPDLGESYRHDRTALTRRIENSAWDGEWYLRAFNDEGTPLGAAASVEARIDSIPQSWAWLCGAADPERAGRALESAWSHLVREDEGLVLLLAPPFDKLEPSPGYIKGYPPGARENGGQYTHAALWLAMAMARRGDGARAFKLLRMLNPIEHARDPQSVWRYGIEPYVVAGDVYRLPDRIGHGGWSWYTGSAAWMYRAWVEEVLGLQLRGETLRITPVIPGEWDGFQMSYRHGEAVYEIVVENPEHREAGVAWVELDGGRVENGVIGLERDLVKHRVLVHMGKPQATQTGSGWTSA